MKEDLRHKLWMLALSLLGSFLAMPVMWLLRYSDVDLTNINFRLANTASPEYAEMIADSVKAMADYYRDALMLSSSVVAMLGAVIVGVEAFRFLQQKSMVDTYHSLPVSRTRLFWIKYVNGLLIWLIPHLLCTVLTLTFSGVLLARIGAVGGVFNLIWEAGRNTIALLIVFMLIYHLMLLATMLTGNILNTLVVAGILGGGVLATYGLVIGFMTTFFHTYYARLGGLSAAVYASPLAAPFLIIAARVDVNLRVSDIYLFTALAEALALGLSAWFFYLIRPSERAGKGLELRWIAWPFRLFAGILGGMGGWLFMYYLIEGSASRMAWSVFGALLVGILAYGMLDVIFSMDFKAFFRHRWSMGISMTAMLLACVGFQQDWFGYDRYLPDESQIREISIACRSYGSYDAELVSLTDTVDTARIYAFLKRGIENRQGRGRKPEEVLVEEAYCGDTFARDTFYVRMVLDNQSVYYRKYNFYEWDQDVVLPLLCSEAYVKGVYGLTESQVASCLSMSFGSGTDNGGEVWETVDRKIIRELAEAYNQDLSEHPQAVMLGEGRLLGRIFLQIQEDHISIGRLDVLESMTHTLEAMEKNGLRVPDPLVRAQDVESITFRVNGGKYWYKGDLAIPPQERSIRGYFGVFPEQLPEAREEGGAGTEAQSANAAGVGKPLTEVMQDGTWEAETLGEQLTREPHNYSFTITDPAEIEEVLALVWYDSAAYRRGVFSEGLVSDVSILTHSGTEWGVCLRRGALPEKYIRRFLEEAEDQ